MTDQQATPAPKVRKRSRSPSFPFISLEKALERASAMEESHHQFPTAPSTLANTWDVTIKSSTYLQTVSALKAFGLIEDEGVGEARRLKLTELARRILLEARDELRDAAVKEAATNPPLLREFWGRWSGGRPSDTHCISELRLDHKFTQSAAANFLKVFDETFRFADIGQNDNVPDSNEVGSDDEIGRGAGSGAHKLDEKFRQPPPPVRRPPSRESERRVELVDGEYELMTGLLSKNTNFRLVVSGHIGPKEIERLIAKLKMDKDILADADGE